MSQTPPQVSPRADTRCCGRACSGFSRSPPPGAPAPVSAALVCLGYLCSQAHMQCALHVSSAHTQEPTEAPLGQAAGGGRGGPRSEAAGRS